MARPREFDVDQAIQTATGMFQERGYANTSIADLTAELGILRGSLYPTPCAKPPVRLLQASPGDIG